MRVEIPEDRPRVEMPLHVGGTVVLLPLSPEDRPYLEEGLSELSPESRFARFGMGLESLSRAELAYLADIDQRRHVAWGAVVGDEGAGVGRYFVVGDGRAEVAITVLDRYQGTGVGTALLTALAAVAVADGLEALHIDVSPANRKVLEWLAASGITLDDGGDGLIKGDVPLRGVTVPHADRLVAAMEEFRSLSPPGRDPGPGTPS